MACQQNELRKKEMKVTTITCEWSETIRPGDYQSRKVGLIVQAQLEEGDDPRKIADQLMSGTRKRVLDAIKLNRDEPMPALGSEQVEVKIKS